MGLRTINKSTTFPIATFDYGAAVKAALQQIQTALAAQNLVAFPPRFMVGIDAAGTVTFTYWVQVWPVGTEPDFIP